MSPPSPNPTESGPLLRKTGKYDGVKCVLCQDTELEMWTSKMFSKDDLKLVAPFLCDRQKHQVHKR